MPPTGESLAQLLRRPPVSARARGASRLSGMEPMSVEEKTTTFADLKTRIAMTAGFLSGIDAERMEGVEDREIATLKVIAR